MINPVWLARNVKRAFTLCPNWNDRIYLLHLMYAGKLPAFAQPKPNRPITFCYAPPVGTIKVILRNNKGSDTFIFGEVFDHRYYDFDLLVPPKTILDLGANAGFTAIFLARKFHQAQVACVEPIPQNVSVLRRNLILNGIQAQVFEAAVAVEDGIIRMAMGDRDYGHKVVETAVEDDKTVLGCKGISVASLMERLTWKRIGLLKIDIEGYERFLLKEKCEWLNRVDAICIECHPGYGEADLRALARGYGFLPPQLLRGIWLMQRDSCN